MTIALATMIALGLSGCAGSRNDDTPPAQSEPAPVVTSRNEAPKAPPADAKPLPSVAYSERYGFAPNTPVAAKPMDIKSEWNTLQVTYWQNSTAACYVMANDPPEGTGTGSAPKIVLESPVTKTRYEFTDLVSSASCNTGGAAGTVLKTAMQQIQNEYGMWNVTVKGRGQNVDLSLLVLGR